MIGIKRLDALHYCIEDMLERRGGYAIVDDYGDVPACRQAIDWNGVFWKKASG